MIICKHCKKEFTPTVSKVREKRNETGAHVTLISWFLNLFRNDRVSITCDSMHLGIKVGDHAYLSKHDTPLDEAIMDFLAWYISGNKKDDAEELGVCKFCQFRIEHGYCNCLASQGVK